MKTPVLIAAFKEANYIGPTLESLDANTVEPLVIVNGEGPTSSTTREAAYYGARVLIEDQQGKLPALQAGLQYLGDEAARKPVLFLDADSRPCFPRRWSAAMLNAMQGTESPVVVGAHRILNDGPVLDNTYRTIRTYQDKRRLASQQDARAVSGANMGIRLQSPQLFEAVLQLEPTWPGEDWLIADTILQHGGELRYADGFNAAVMTSARFNPRLKELVGLSIEERRDLFFQRYIERAAPGTRFAYIDGQLHPYDQLELASRNQIATASGSVL